MDYNYFIKTIKECGKGRIKALSFPASSAVSTIPTVVGALFPEIINILCGNIQRLCQENQVVAIFGLQTVSIAFTSELPIKLNRIFYNKWINRHIRRFLSLIWKFDKEEHRAKVIKFHSSIILRMVI